MCKVHFCETDFWTLVMQNWHNGQGAKELAKGLVKGRGREDKSLVVDSRKKSRVVGEVILITQGIYYPLSAVK